MKKIFVSFLCVTLMACEPVKFTGYVVCKEYTPGHMSNENVDPVQCAVIVPHAHPAPPHYVDPIWVVYVANRDRVESINVDSLRFTKIKLLQKITVEL